MNDSEAHSPPLGVPSASPPLTDIAPAEQSIVGDRPARRLGLGPAGTATLIGATSLLLPLGWCGLWAPYELEMADLSRRIAVVLHGATGLSVPSANNTVPILSELGKGQLPFSSVAVGFQLFGLSDWAGRLPLALWAVLGLVATYLLVARLMDRVAAAYATAALATMPLYFLQARTMLGDGVTLAAAALGSAGLAVSTFYPGVTSTRARWGWWSLALVGLAAGFATRGVLFGVACPALGVGLGWLIWRLSGNVCPTRASNLTGLLSLVLGGAALGLGLYVLFSVSPAAYLEVLGTRLNAASKLPTHDLVLYQLGFGLFPWSALAPFAFALVLGQDGDATPSAALRVCLVSVFLVAAAVHGFSAPYVGSVPFVGTFAVAALAGVALRDAEQRAKSTRLLALGTAALLVVLYADLRTSPEQALGPFSVSDAVFPESFVAAAKAWMKYGSAVCLGIMLLALGELPNVAWGAPTRPDSDSMQWLRRLQRGLGGRLPALLGGVTLLLGALPVLLFLDERGVRIRALGVLGEWRMLAGYAFVVVPAVIVLPILAWLARDIAGVFLAWLPIPRARLALIAFTGFGLLLSLGYYPALAAHLSPRNVFASYRQQAQPGEALAVLGQVSRVAPYYAGAEVQTPKSVRAALDWLLEAPEQRRWLVFGSKDLGQLEHLYRERKQSMRNLPVLDAASSEVMLASNQLRPGEANENPLSQWVSSERPQPQRPLDADLGTQQLHCLGWAITDKSGRPVDEVRTGQPYDFRIYWEVMAALTGTWQTFIHIDGGRRRFNGDHDTLQGKYPFRFWEKGDFITDVYPMQLEPQFSGSTYQVFFGLFTGDKRLPVTRGRHQDDRIMGGALVVR